MKQFNFEEGLKYVKHLATSQQSGKNNLIIGVGGGSCSGKTFFANQLGFQRLKLDDYYVGIDKMENNNFDEPNAIELSLLKKHLKLLKKGEEIEKPIYDFKTHLRKGKEVFKPNNIIVVEGLFALHEELIEDIDIGIFLDANEQTCLNRRIKRDMTKRARTKEGIIDQFYTQVKPNYDLHVLPTKKHATIIINNT